MDSQKLRAMLLCLGEPPVRFLCSCCWFLMCIFICRCSSFCFCFSFYFQATSPCHWHSTLASQTLEGLHQLWAQSRLLLIAFSFSSTTNATDLSRHLLSTDVFYLTLLPNIFGTTCFYQGLPGSWEILYIDPQNTDPAHLFVWFTVIHNLFYILNLYLYMLIFQKFLLVVKTLIKNIDQQPHYSAAMKI